MTIEWAKAHDIKRIRKPYWNSSAYLELPIKGGPWFTLHDIGEEQQIIFSEADDGKADWEEYINDK